MTWLRTAVLIAAVSFTACVSTTSSPGSAPVIPMEMSGLASWYGQEFAGRTTANGEIFDPLTLTAAHRTLPFGTIIDVRNRSNGRAVQVRINDRGPFIGGRVIDLSFAAAEQIGLIEPGVGEVDIIVRKVGAGDREPPVPYNVQITPRPVPIPPAAPGETAPPPVAVIAETAPAEAAPAQRGPAIEAVPVVAGTDIVIDGTDIAIVEERQGTVVRREVGADGKTIVLRPVAGEGSVPATPEAEPPAATSTIPQTPAREVQTIPAPRVTAGTAWVVQVGAFSREQNARDLAGRVQAVIQPVFVERHGDLFRLRVGPFPSRERATEARVKLEDAGFTGIVMPK